MRAVFFVFMLIALLVVSWLVLKDLSALKGGGPAEIGAVQRAEDARRAAEAADRMRAQGLEALDPAPGGGGAPSTDRQDRARALGQAGDGRAATIDQSTQ